MNSRFLLFFCGGVIFITLFFGYEGYRAIPRETMGYLFLFLTLGVYALAGIYFRTTNINEYYLANRNISGLKNGMATAADWISAASFISLAGQFYNLGFEGYAYLIGWSGGFCLLAFLVAPYLRQSALYTLPDFFAHRFPRPSKNKTFVPNLSSHSNTDTNIDTDHANLNMRLTAALASILICFVYVVAQIYGVGLIVSRLTGIDFTIGIFIALAGILVCSFLGGMRAITWTQVLQYLILILALLLTLGWISMKHFSNPIPHLAYAQILGKTQALEMQNKNDSKENEIRHTYDLVALDYQKKINALPQSWREEQNKYLFRLNHLKQNNASFDLIKKAEAELAQFPKNSEEALMVWQKALIEARQHSHSFNDLTAPANNDIREGRWFNFIALVFCLMIGTASLPHILTRSYTAQNVRAARKSIFWTLFFILLFYLSLPLLVMLVKYELHTQLIGVSFDALPNWVLYWTQLDRKDPLLHLLDMNGDNIVQAGEIIFSNDSLMLAAPEIASLPFVLSALIAAGALAAALSTADGLLLSIASICSHDIYFHLFSRESVPRKRVTVSKLVLLVMAMLAAYLASLRPGNIVLLVEIAFSLSASIFFPSLVLAVMWRRANYYGTLWAMAVGLLVTVCYFFLTYPGTGGSPDSGLLDIGHGAAGLFGVIAGFITHAIVSSVTKPNPATDQFVAHLRRA